jgi:hypothetical protein
MRSWLVFPDCQNSIKQEYSLFSSLRQVSILWRDDSQIILKLFEDILKRWRLPNSILDRETKPMSLSFSMIGILPENHDFYLIKRRHIEGIEDI